MGTAYFALKIEWQKNASGKVTCDAESGKLGAHQVGGCWGLTSGAGARRDQRGSGGCGGWPRIEDTEIFIVLGHQNLG